MNFLQNVKLPIEYSDKPVTPFSGMSLMKRFLDQTGIMGYVSTSDLPQPGSNREYDPSDIVSSFGLSIWTGASRYIHCDWLRYDNVLQSIFGLEQMPSQRTYSRFLENFPSRVIQRFPRFFKTGFLTRSVLIISRLILTAP